ncbi:MAG: isoleucine--tRNA ligase [Nitrospirota bacterium]|nr:isoleucine--tRNA ligase [Nitrospirota bacterium]
MVFFKAMADNYKDTLNLPRTDFPMKANLSKREPEILHLWEEKKIYEKLQGRGGSAGTYILHDGPPYANGHIHMGHALNKVLKDIIVKYKTMKGFYAPYVPGWDCHGLPIEIQVDKNLGSKKNEIDIVRKRGLCKEYAAKFVDIQREEFKRLGVFGDWTNPYLTMSHEYEAAIVREFNDFFKKGYVYKGKKPVHWCPSCVTALAEAEVEHADKESPSIFVKFKVKDSKGKIKTDTGDDAYFVIWTTTPWTLPANMALTLHPDFTYCLVKTADGGLILARELVETCMDKIGYGEDEYTVTELVWSGAELEGIACSHPWIDRTVETILGGHVTLEQGTGVVHTAPGHGEDDYTVGLKYSLDVYAPVDDRGIFTGDAGLLEGQFVFKANASVIEILKSKNSLLKEEKIIHSYPHCWRCKKPVIFRATEQWFISVEHNNLRKNCLNEIDKVNWVPEWGRDRIYGMVMNRPDWCVSRQRSWGVPITLIECRDCGEIVDDESILNDIAELVREHGADIWFIKGVDEILPEGYRCKKCGGSGFAKEMDILDVWFDSGVSHAAVIERDERFVWPSDLYLEGSDQHRGWFQSSLLASTGTRGRAPYRTVLTHGFVVDGSGKKMSKSLGNVIAPQEIIRGYGAEILRIWVASEDYRDDIRISKEILSRLTEAYRKIRNTCRFLIGNLYDFDNNDYSDKLQDVDRWAMSRIQGLIGRATGAYENYDFHEAFHSIHNFCVVDMSSFYFDVLKDRLYTDRADSTERRASQWVLSEILSALTGLMAPVLSFTAEEVYGYIRNRGAEESDKNGPESVFLSSFPVVREEFIDMELEERWKGLLDLRDEINKALEIKRAEKFIGNSLEARVRLYLPEKYMELCRPYTDSLPAFFLVSAVEIADTILAGSYESIKIEGLQVAVERASGNKCLRCWGWSDSVGSFEDAPDVCGKCYKVIK